MKTSEMKGKDYVFVALKGTLLGLVSLGIPGVSASTVGIIIGIYFTMVDAIANIFKDFRHNATFLLALMIGYAAGSVGAAFSVWLTIKAAPFTVRLTVEISMFSVGLAGICPGSIKATIAHCVILSLLKIVPTGSGLPIR